MSRRLTLWKSPWCFWDTHWPQHATAHFLQYSCRLRPGCSPHSARLGDSSSAEKPSPPTAPGSPSLRDPAAGPSSRTTSASVVLMDKAATPAVM
ncbi:hypothetical protein FKM82_026241 [Ascaphus truei]